MLTGLAAMIGKVRQVLTGGLLVPIDSLSQDERADLHLQARALVNSQSLDCRVRARGMALERAEQVVGEEGAIVNTVSKYLARRIADEAVTTYLLSIEGSLDTPKTGGVQ